MAKISLILCSVIFFVGLANASIANQEVGIYELKQGNFSVKLTNWGAGIISVIVPDKNGKLADIALGYDSVKEYMNDTGYLGAIVGRVANRIGGAKFTLNGTVYKLPANDGNNTLHGGTRGFSDVVWKVKDSRNKTYSPHITFTYRSHDGEEGFPGDLHVSVTYSLLAGKQLSVVMRAKALNKATPVNLAQHTYWNLGGQNSGNILSEEVQIFASNYTPVDGHLIPTGKIAPVKGTPYDFLEPQTVGSRINKLPSGYDINYVLDDEKPHGEKPHGEKHHSEKAHGEKTHTKLKKAAIVKDKKSGRVMELWTNAPGMQFYSSNFLKNVTGKGGYVYQPHDALCLETQGFPDAVNHPNFPSQIVTPKKSYKHYMLYKFSA